MTDTAPGPTGHIDHDAPSQLTQGVHMTTNTVTTTTVWAEIQAGEGVTLGQVARSLPGHRDNKTLHPTTILRRILRGTKTPDGRTVRLEGVRDGNRWLSSRGAVARYVAALTPVTNPEPKPVARTTSASQAAAQRANDALEKRGA